MATITAQLRNTRLAPRKVRAVVDLLRGKNALVALDQVSAWVRRPSDPVAKLIRSAIANATHNFNMVPSNLFIKEFYVDEGVKLKRYRPKGFGRAGEIQKKTSHIHIVLEETVAGLKGDASTAKKHEHTHEHAAPVAKKTGKPEVKTELGKKTDETKGKGVRRMFQRKSI